MKRIFYAIAIIAAVLGGCLQGAYARSGKARDENIGGFYGDGVELVISLPFWIGCYLVVPVGATLVYPIDRLISAEDYPGYAARVTTCIPARVGERLDDWFAADLPKSINSTIIAYDPKSAVLETGHGRYRLAGILPNPEHKNSSADDAGNPFEPTKEYRLEFADCDAAGSPAKVWVFDDTGTLLNGALLRGPSDLDESCLSRYETEMRDVLGKFMKHEKAAVQER